MASFQPAMTLSAPKGGGFPTLAALSALLLPPLPLLGHDLLFQVHQGVVHFLPGHQGLRAGPGVLDPFHEFFGIQFHSLALEVPPDLIPNAVTHPVVLVLPFRLLPGEAYSREANGNNRREKESLHRSPFLPPPTAGSSCLAGIPPTPLDNSREFPSKRNKL